LKDHKIFFLHIPKCGGTSISEAIANCYKPWRNNGSGRVVKFNSAAARFTDEHSLGTGNDVRRDLLNYMMSLPNVRCIVGHFHFSSDAFEAYGKHWDFVTVLRDPVERWLSQYSYNTNASSRYAINMPIEEFVLTDRAASFGRIYVDEMTIDVDKKKYDVNKLKEIAVGRLKKFSLVGALDSTDEFVRKFEETFAYKLEIKHLNRTPRSKKVGVDNIPPGVVDEISKLCKPDIELYNEVLMRGDGG
jgi:hypothetical protein